MNLTALLFLINDLLFIGLILLVLLIGKTRNLYKILFILLNLSLLTWSLTLSLYYNVTSNDVLLFIGRINFIAINAGFICLYFFTKTFPNNPKNLFNKWDLLILLSSGIIPLTLFTNLIIKEEIALANGNRETVFGEFYFLYIAQILFVFFISILHLYKNYKNSNSFQKTQIRYFLIGLIIAIIFGFTTNAILPLLGYFNLQALGPFATIILSSTIYLLIVKHKLFDIRLVIGKFIYYLLAAIPPYLTYFALAFIYESIYGTSFNPAAYVVGVPVAILFTAFVNFFTRFISEYTDSHLVNPGYSPLVVLEQLRQRLSTSLDVEKIIQESLFIIARTIRPESSGVILITNDQTNALISYNYKKDPFPRPQDFNMFLQFFITRNLRSITANDLENSEEWLSIDQVLVSHLLTQMTKFKIEVILPLKEEQKIRGMLLVGFKEAQAPYNAQEIKLLYSISETMTLAIGRALSYKEIQQFNETLQKKVTDATTELQQKNKALEEAFLKLEEVRRQEKDMLDVMGHELRTPISIARNAVIALQKLFDRNDLNPEKNRKYTNMAVESIRREIALIETFLSTTKLEGGRMQMNLEPVSLVKVVEDSLIAHQDLSKRNKTILSFERPEQDIIVQADKIRIQEVADNFVNNAIKYTGEGSVELSIYENEGLGWIDVKDDGIGISPENLAKLGRKFFRAQTLYNKTNNVVNPSGTGLGLFVSFQLIDLMKGRKKIVSEEGKGSTFSFGLPLYAGSNIAPNDKP